MKLIFIAFVVFHRFVETYIFYFQKFFGKIIGISYSMKLFHGIFMSHEYPTINFEFHGITL